MIQHLINEIIKKNNGTQMTKEEYEYIASFLQNINFLVFGTGHDSNLWRLANSEGLTTFLEHNKKWISNHTDIIKITYTTTISAADQLLEEYRSGNHKNLEIYLPEIVQNTKWDCILVDSPEGFNKKSIGRMQSIYTARKLANKKTNIFIHDCDRYVEDLYSKEFFTKQVKQFTKLKHFKI